MKGNAEFRAILSNEVVGTCELRFDTAPVQLDLMYDAAGNAGILLARVGGVVVESSQGVGHVRRSHSADGASCRVVDGEVGRDLDHSGWDAGIGQIGPEWDADPLVDRSGAAHAQLEVSNADCSVRRPSFPD